MSPHDPLRLALWTGGLGIAAFTAALRPDAAALAMRATAGPFATLAAIILASALAGRLGAFRILARALVPDRGPAAASAAAILAFTAALSALVNLDVAVLVAMPVALRAAQRQHLPAGRLSIAVAMTANATSFLFPTSNITSLLLLHRAPLATTAYISDSWLPWLLVTAITLGPLAIWAGRRAPDTITATTGGPSAGAVSDLVPMFLIASGIRALLGTGLVLHGSFASQLTGGSALAAAADNLPAAAAVLPASRPGLWAAILATTIGPNLLATGSVATLISRRIARDAGARLSAWQITAIGLALVPAQLAAATLGLHIAGVLR
jgi:Na+/H+ antiporter NhaD/arsenite permease-like protein